MAFLALANMLLLSTVGQYLNSAEGPSQGQIWIVFGLNILFFLGFGSSAYGLFKRHNWGRLIFLWSVVIWSSFNLIALFAPSLFYADQEYTFKALSFNVLRYAISLFLPLWYLNLSWIKEIFHTQSPENLSTEEITIDDNA